VAAVDAGHEVLHGLVSTRGLHGVGESVARLALPTDQHPLHRILLEDVLQFPLGIPFLEGFLLRFLSLTLDVLGSKFPWIHESQLGRVNVPCEQIDLELLIVRVPQIGQELSEFLIVELLVSSGRLTNSFLNLLSNQLHFLLLRRKLVPKPIFEWFGQLGVEIVLLPHLLPHL